MILNHRPHHTHSDFVNDIDPVSFTSRVNATRPQMSAASLNVCLTCLKSYKRPEHLRRHQSSHSAERRFHCESCNKTFQRSDVLKRHLTTCDPGTASELRPKKRPAWSNVTNPAVSVPVSSADLGRTAPDLSAIDPDLLQVGLGGRPFGHMAGWITGGMSSFPCSDSSDAIWQEFINFTPGTQTPCSVEPETEDRSEDLDSLSFLENFTSNSGLVSSFDCGTLDQRRQFASELAESERASDLIKSHTDPRAADAFILSFAGATESDIAGMEQCGTDAGDRYRDPLLLKSQEIINIIELAILLKSPQSPVSLVWSSSVQTLCLQFFSPENMRRYLECYWAIWHPNVNFMHKPTFDPLSSKAALVAAMSLIGGRAPAETI
jgi:Zinc finger, C2H2 type